MNEFSNKTADRDFISYGLTERSFQILIFLSLVSFGLMIFHDIDHLRVILGRHYTIVPGQYVSVVTAYIPTVVAFWLAIKRSKFAAVASMLGGITIVIGASLYHLIGASAVNSVMAELFLGVWKDSFFALHVDGMQWIDLAALIGWNSFVSIASFTILGDQISGRSSHS